MNTAAVIRRLKNRIPKTAQAILDDCELPLQYIGGGCFRDTYHVLGTDIVIKVPRRGYNTKGNIRHSRNEFRIWNRMMSESRFRSFRKYLPRIIYYNDLTGIIVMPKYTMVKDSRDMQRIANRLEKDTSSALGVHDADIHTGNIGTDKNGKLKIIDMGLFIAGKV